MDCGLEQYTKTFRKNVAYNIAKNRVKRKWSRRKLASICDLKSQSIGKIEREEVTINGNSLCKIAYAFGLEPEALIESPNKVDFHDKVTRFLEGMSESEIEKMNDIWEGIVHKL